MKTIPDLVRELALADAHALNTPGRGKAARFKAREQLADELAEALIAAAGLTDWATLPDVIDIARGQTTVAAVNARLGAMQAEMEEEA